MIDSGWFKSMTTTQDRFSLDGRTALITAGASGMGRAAAELFAARGAHVIVVDMNAAGCNETIAAIERAGGSAEAHAFDLTDDRALDAFLDDLVAHREVVDVLYNHAGIWEPAGFDYDAESWTRCMKLNVWVPMLTTQRLLPLLRRSASASIIFTASVSGLVASPYRLTYSASKGAVVLFMKSTAVMLGPEGIRANAICPGPINTPAFLPSFEEEGVNETYEEFLKAVPLRRPGEPDEVAHVALFLASDASRFMTGVAVPVDGGYVAR